MEKLNLEQVYEQARRQFYPGIKFRRSSGAKTVYTVSSPLAFRESDYVPNLMIRTEEEGWVHIYDNSYGWAVIIEQPATHSEPLIFN